MHLLKKKKPDAAASITPPPGLQPDGMPAPSVLRDEVVTAIR